MFDWLLDVLGFDMDSIGEALDDAYGEGFQDGYDAGADIFEDFLRSQECD
ncbi:MAG: hypothetical protein ACM3X0_07320 [Bacteroidota bacterium]